MYYSTLKNNYKMSEEKALLAAQILERLTKFRRIFKILVESREIPEIVFRCKDINFKETTLHINGEDPGFKSIFVEFNKDAIGNHITRLEKELENL